MAIRISSRMTRRTALAAGLGFAAGAVIGPRWRRPNVVLVVLDALRADHVGVGLTPTIDALALRGASFSNAYSASTQTKVSVASIFTGGPPAYHGVLPLDSTLNRGSWTLARMFKNAGYSTMAVISNPWLWPEEDRRRGFSQGFDIYNVVAPGKGGGLSEGVRFYPDEKAVCAHLKGLLYDYQAIKPLFAYVHLMETHQPWVERSSPDLPLVSRALTRVRTLTDAEHRRMRDVYAGAVRRVDAGLADVLETLASAGIRPDNSIIIATADHGDELHERKHYGHCGPPTEELVRVPLVMAGKGIKCGWHDQLVSNIALLDTLSRFVSPEGAPRGTFFPSLLDDESYPVIAEFMGITTPVEVDRAIIMPDGGKLMWADVSDGRTVGEHLSRWRSDGALWQKEALRAEATKTWRRWEALAESYCSGAGPTALAWQTDEATDKLSAKDIALRKQLQAIGYLN